MGSGYRIASRFLLGAALAGASIFTSATAPLVASPERSADGAVTVRAKGTAMDGVGAGTIVSVSGTRVTMITAKHVATYGTLQVGFDDQTRAPARILALIPDRDLALIVADVDPELAATLHAAPIGQPVRSEYVHVWGSGLNGPAFEPAAVDEVGVKLPDGAIRERYTLNCGLCHEGDSGAGVFDARGELVGIYVGYFSMERGNLGVAELPLNTTGLAANGVPQPSLDRMITLFGHVLASATLSMDAARDSAAALLTTN